MAWLVCFWVGPSRPKSSNPHKADARQCMSALLASAMQMAQARRACPPLRWGVDSYVAGSIYEYTLELASQTSAPSLEKHTAKLAGVVAAQAEELRRQHNKDRLPVPGATGAAAAWLVRRLACDCWTRCIKSMSNRSSAAGINQAALTALMLSCIIRTG